MNKKSIKPKSKLKARVSKTKNKKSKKKSINSFIDKMKSNSLFIITLFTGVLLIVSSYAWLSASLNVKIKFFDLSVSTDNGLFISLDGVEYSDSIEISLNSVINDLRATYPNHTNQWAAGGLWPVSSNGIKTPNNDKFDIYIGEISRYKLKLRNRKFLNTRLGSEDNYSSYNAYIAFDIFLKNVSGSPKSDNLYLTEGTFVDYEEDTPEDIRESMRNLMNSMRFGFVKIGSLPSKSDIRAIQNMKCNNECQMVIYEPNHLMHSQWSIDKAAEYNITLVDGVYSPTYGVINEGTFLEHTNGHEGTGIPLDTEHFALQNTIKFEDFINPIFQIPNAVTKVRVYVWIEGQDIDSLETNSKGAAIYISIDLEKDLAGYE
jgi:hypothetical protein